MGCNTHEPRRRSTTQQREDVIGAIKGIAMLCSANNTEAKLFLEFITVIAEKAIKLDSETIKTVLEHQRELEMIFTDDLANQSINSMCDEGLGTPLTPSVLDSLAEASCSDDISKLNWLSRESILEILLALYRRNS